MKERIMEDLMAKIMAMPYTHGKPTSEKKLKKKLKKIAAEATNTDIKVKAMFHFERMDNPSDKKIEKAKKFIERYRSTTAGFAEAPAEAAAGFAEAPAEAAA